MNTVDYYKFIDTLRILHNKYIYEYIEFFIKNQNNNDIITYYKTENFLLLNIEMLNMDKNNNYYFEYDFSRNADIIDNIKYENLNNNNINIKISYNISNIIYEYEDIKEILLLCAPYAQMKIRITFLEKPNNNFKFNIIYRIYLLSKESRNYLKKNTIITYKNIYKDGMVYLKNFKL